MNQSETDLGIVNESQLLRFGISASPVRGTQAQDAPPVAELNVPLTHARMQRDPAVGDGGFNRRAISS
jgi:hypothetical protein